MGEIADYILNGDDCQECGQHIGNGDGYPRSCADCGGNNAEEQVQNQPQTKGKHNLRNRRKRERQRNNKLRAQYIGTLPKSDFPWKFTRCSDGIVCCNPDHPPLLLQAGKIIPIIIKPQEP